MSTNKNLDILAKEILGDMRGKKTEHISDLKYAEKLLNNFTQSSECYDEKLLVVRTLVMSVWLQRVNFIVRSFLMGLVATFIALAIILYLG